jgi:hypothetical protein
MNKYELKIIDFTKSLIEDKSIIINLNTELIGASSLLDSMKLVELCLLLEDYANELGFEFDWTSESAMSKSRSIFKSLKTLIDEFQYQLGI